MNFNTKHSLSQQSHIQLIDKSIFLLISICLTVYLVIRATLVPLAHDEIATFYYFVQSGNISPFLSNIDTNNHFLNSLLTWVFYHIWGPSPLALRLSNLVFAPVFFYFLYSIAKHLKSRVSRYALFISIAFTLHFIEFLALSRGYGISMTLLLGSLFYLLQAVETQNRQKYFYSMCCIFVACTANLALINTYALVLLFIALTMLIHTRNRIKSTLIFILLAGIAPISIILVQIFYIKAHAGLIAGSPHNFWGTTIVTLFTYLFETTPRYAGLIGGLLFSLIAICGAFTFYELKRIKFIFNSKPLLFLYLFVGNIILILILGIFFKVNYPDDRIGIYLYPLAVGSLVFMLDHLISDKKWAIAFAIPFLAIPVHFFIVMNTTYSIWYRFDVIPKRYYEQVMQSHKPGTVPPTIAGHGMRIFCWSYLDYLKGGMASQVFFTNFPDYNADFQIVNLKMIPGWQQVYDTIDYDPVSERHLLRLHSPFIPTTLINRRIQTIRSTSAEFVPIGDGLADTLRDKNIRVDLNLSLNALSAPFNSRIVVNIWDKDHKSLRYEYIHLNWLRNSWKGEAGNFSNCMLVYQVPPEAVKYEIYLWNIDKTEFDIKEGYYSINELKPRDGVKK